MANEQNLKPSEYKLSQEEAKKGGINSGKARRKKADLRKAVQAILTSEYTDKKGKQATGEDIIIQGFIANLANPNSRNWGKAMDLFVTLTGANLSDEQKAKIKAETQLLQAKADMLKGGNAADIEDLTPLAEMLNNVENTDD